MAPAGAPAGTASNATSADARVVYVVDGPAQAAGASMSVAGLPVRERAMRQLRRMGREPVAVAGDAEVPAGAASVQADVVRSRNDGIEGGLRVTDEASRRAAEDDVFAQLLRGDLGLVARHLNKPISFRVTRHLLCHLPVTPNQVTLAAASIGFVGAALIAVGGYGAMLVGFVLAHLQSVLDGCDGELARVRFQQSRFGEWFDTIADDAVNLALLAGLGVGLARGGSPRDLTIGLVGCAMLAFFNLVSYWSLWRQRAGGETLRIRWWFSKGADLKTSGPAKSPLIKLVWQLGRRDTFLVALIVFAALDYAFLALVGWMVIVVIDFVIALGQIVVRPR